MRISKRGWPKPLSCSATGERQARRCAQSLSKGRRRSSMLSKGCNEPVARSTISMRQGALSALSAMAIVACAVSSSNAQQDEARQWRLTKDDDGHAALAYGTESAEDVSIVFDCNPRSGAIRVFVAETN